MIYFDLFESKKEIVYENCGEFFMLGDANLIWEPKIVWPVLEVKWGYGEPSIVTFYVDDDCDSPTKRLSIKSLWLEYFKHSDLI